MAKLKVQKRKALLLAVAALMCASMLVQGVLQTIAQDDDVSIYAVTITPQFECIKYDDQGVCVKWRIVTD